MAVYHLKQNDEYPTPAYLVKPILEFIKPHWKVWCPFDTKDSEFVKQISLTNRVHYSHLKTGQDFLTYDYTDFDVIVSNPPFSLKQPILTKCLKLNKPFALIFGIQVLNSGGINKLIKAYDWDLQILAFDKRAKFDMSVKATPPFMTVYLCNKLLPKAYFVKELIM